MGYQRILDSKGVQTFYGRRNEKKKRILWRWKMEVWIVKDTMGIAWNKLEFQKPHEHHPF
jgi:hypothetical protein